MSAIVDTLAGTLQSDPTNWQFRHALVEALIAEERRDEAHAVLTEVAELPTDADSLITAAKAYAAFDPASGIQVLDGLISSDPTCARAHFEKAVLHYQAGDIELAKKQYTAAITFDPALADPEFSSWLDSESQPAAQGEPASTVLAQAPPQLERENVVYPEPGQYPTITLAEAKQVPAPRPLVDPNSIPEHPHLEYVEEHPHADTVHTPEEQFIEQVHPVSVHTAYHKESVSYDYQHPDDSIFEPTITDEEIYVGALITDTGEPVATLQESVRRNKEQKEAEIANREKNAKLQSFIVACIMMTAICLLMILVVSAAPRPAPPQIVANSVAVPTEDPIEKPTLVKATPKPTASSSSMSMDVVTVEAASNLSMVSFDSPLIDLGQSSIGNDFGSSMTFGDGDGGGSVMFFGGKSTGKRFLFVLDASASMKTHQVKLRDDELEKTLKTLRNVDYHVLLFASGGYYAEKGWGVDMKKKTGRGHTNFFAPWGDYFFKEMGGLHAYEMIDEKDFKHPKWLRASASSVRKSVKFVRESKKFVGTDWDTALKMGFQMDPPPDVIFFMSDGGDPKLNIDDIMSAGRKAGKPKINCIAMQTLAGAANFSEIAKKSRGTFTIVDKDGEPLDGDEVIKDPAAFAGRLK